MNGYGIEQPKGTREVLGWRDVTALGRLAEELRYESVFSPEIGGWEAFTLLGGISARTESLGLVSGVIPLRSRDPHRLAMGAASLQEASAGRFVLGVGSSESIERTGSALSELRQMIAGGTDWITRPRSTPIYLAALGPRMTALAAETADGVILNWCTPERVAEARAAIGPRDDFTIAVYVRACLSHVDEQAGEALRIAASRYATMPPYARQFEAMGVAPADIDAIVSATCVRGDRDQALARLDEYSAAGADVVVVYPVPAGEAVSSITGTMMAAAPGALS